MLRGGTGQQWTGTYDLTFKHHSRTDTLRRSKQAGCSICTVLAKELRQEIDLLEDEDITVAANLSKVKTPELNQAIYRLDFVLQKKLTRTFVLMQTCKEFHKPATSEKTPSTHC
jgi:hypothetical protein